MSSPVKSNAPVYREAMRAAWLGLGVNVALGIIKLAGGLIARSFALISDAINSIGDALTSIIVIFGLWFAQRPPDDEHPYGHTRAEAVAASNVALLIIITACLVAFEAIRRLPVINPIPPVWALWIAMGNIFIKEGLYQYKCRVGKRTGSMSVIANAWDHRSDAFCSFAVLVGLCIVRWAGPAYSWADEAAALVVVVAILGTGITLFRASASDLLDPQADQELVAQIRASADSVAGVRAVEKLWVRKTGLEYLADIHIQVDAKTTVDEGHRVGHEVKDRLLAQFASLRDVLVHLEPYPHTHEPK